MSARPAVSSNREEALSPDLQIVQGTFFPTLQLIHKLLDFEEGAEQLFGCPGCVEAIVRLLTPQNFRLQSIAASIVGQLAEQAEFWRAVLNLKDGIAAFLGLLMAESLELQRAGIGCLEHLAADGPEGLQMLASQGLPQLQHALTSKSSTTRKGGALLLGSICQDCHGAQVLTASNVDALLAMLASDQVTERAAAASMLGCFAQASHSGRGTCNVSIVVAALLGLLKPAQSEEHWLELTHAARALENLLAGDRESKSRVAKLLHQGPHAALLVGIIDRSMAAHPTPPTAGARLLRWLSSDSQEAKHSVAAAGGIPVLSALLAQPAQAAHGSALVVLLQLLQLSKDYCHQLFSSQIISTLPVLLQSESRRVQELAALLTAALASTSSAARYMLVGAGVPKPYGKVLEGPLACTPDMLRDRSAEAVHRSLQKWRWG